MLERIHEVDDLRALDLLADRGDFLPLDLRLHDFEDLLAVFVVVSLGLEFKPERYHDEYREKVLEVVESKVEGKEITSIGEQVQRTQVIDLMDALKQSLEGRVAKEGRAGAKKPAAKASRTTTATKERKRASR